MFIPPSHRIAEFLCENWTMLRKPLQYQSTMIDCPGIPSESALHKGSLQRNAVIPY